MAIPKEPRQLMINIMYLVLTALLALNVSAEIFNAFKVVDKGLKKSNSVLDSSNDQMAREVPRLAKKKADLQKYADRTGPARELSKEMSTYIDGILDGMIEESGGFDEEHGFPVGKKDKAVTTRTLVDEGKGDELEQKLRDAKKKFLELIDEEDRAAFEKEIAISIDEEWKNHPEKSSWADYNFRQMPLGATLPLFSKMKNDVKSTESAVLNYLLGKVGGEDIVFENYRVVASPKKSYIIKGEKYEADIFLSAASDKNSKVGLSIQVNNRNLPVNDGVAKLVLPANSTGVKKYTATITTKNPITGEVKSYNSQFEFEVGERSVSVSAEKMNVLYIGVDNPIAVSAAGVSSNDLKVNGSGGGIKLNRQGVGKYIARVSSPGKATINVSGGGLPPTKSEFRVKRIPDPVAKIAGKRGGRLASAAFKVQDVLVPDLEGFDFDARCNIGSFTLIRSPKPGSGEDASISKNTGARFGGKVKSAVSRAKPGDLYVFDEIKCKCPGDPASGRTLNSVTIRIN